MSQFVSSLRRLFHAKKISREKIDKLYQKKLITETERSYILLGD